MSTPSDTYLLRVGFGGVTGPTTNIRQDGFASASFHSFEDTLEWDGYSGDYGPNFVGVSIGTTAVLVDMGEEGFGWQAFGGVVTSSEGSVEVEVKDAVRRRIFVAPIGQLLELDAGVFTTLSYDASARSVTVGIAASSGTSGAADAEMGRLLVRQTADVEGVGALSPTGSLEVDAGAWSVPFEGGKASVVLKF